MVKKGRFIKGSRPKVVDRRSFNVDGSERDPDKTAQGLPKKIPAAMLDPNKAPDAIKKMAAQKASGALANAIDASVRKILQPKYAQLLGVVGQEHKRLEQMVHKAAIGVLNAQGGVMVLFRILIELGLVDMATIQEYYNIFNSMAEPDNEVQIHRFIHGQSVRKREEPDATAEETTVGEEAGSEDGASHRPEEEPGSEGEDSQSDPQAQPDVQQERGEGRGPGEELPGSS